MKAGVALAFVAAALVVVVESCGGTAKPHLTVAQFQQRANTICLRYHRGMAKLGAPTSLPRIAKVASGAATLGAAERRALAQLRAPKDSADSFARMLDRFGKADALLPKLRQAALKGDTGTAQALAGQGQALVGAGNREATALGLADCLRS